MNGLNGLKEVTGPGFPEHTYFLSRDNEAIYAYYDCINEAFVMFRKSIRFSKSKRKFQKVVYNG